MTSKITFPLEFINAADVGAGAEVVVWLVPPDGDESPARDLDTNKLVSRAPIRAAVSAGDAVLDLIRNSDLPQGWTYRALIRGANRAGVVFPFTVPDTDRSIVEIMQMVEPGRVPRFALITEEQLTALIDGHGIGVLTEAPVSGTGQTGRAITIADDAIGKEKLDPQLRTDIEDSPKQSLIDGGIGSGNEDQITFINAEGTQKSVTLPTDPATQSQRLARLSAWLPYAAISDPPTIPDPPAGGTADAAELAAEAANIDHLQTFEQSLMQFTPSVAAAGWTQGSNNVWTRLAGNPAIPTGGLPDARLRVTIGGEGDGVLVFGRADLLALPVSAPGLGGDPASTTNAIHFAAEGNTYYVGRDSANRLLVSSDTTGAFTAAFDLGVVRIVKEELEPNQQLPEPVAGQFVKWNAAASALENTPEPSGTDETRVNQLIADGVQDWAETGNTAVIPAAKLPAPPAAGDDAAKWAEEGDTSTIPASKLPRLDASKLPVDLADLMDAVDDAGWRDEGNNAATDAWVQSVPAGGGNLLPNTAPTLAQARAASYAQSFEVSPRVTNRYLALRLPAGASAKQRRLAVGGTTQTSNAWTELGTAGGYTYYASGLIADLPVGAEVRLQEYMRFSLDRDRIYTEDGRIPVLVAADARKWLRINAAATGFEVVDAPAGGGSTPAPAGVPGSLSTKRPSASVTTSGIGTAQTAWQTLITFTVTSAEAGLVVMNAMIRGASTGGSGGGDRIYGYGRLRRTRGSATTTVWGSDDGRTVYVRNTGQLGSGNSAPGNTASRQADYDFSFADEAQTGDVYTMQVSAVAQVAGKTVVWARNENEIQYLKLPTSGAGTPGPPGPPGASARPTASGTAFPAAPSEGDEFDLTEEVKDRATPAVLTARTSGTWTGWNAQGTPEIGHVDRQPAHGVAAIEWHSNTDSQTTWRQRIRVVRSATAHDGPKTPASVTVGTVTHALVRGSASFPETWLTAVVANPFVAGQRYAVQINYSDGTKAWADLDYPAGIYAYDGFVWRRTATVNGADVLRLLLSNSPDDLRSLANRIGSLLPADTHVEIVHDGPGIGSSPTNTNLNHPGTLTLFDPPGRATVFDLDDVEQGQFAIAATLTITTRSKTTLGFQSGVVQAIRRTDIVFASDLKALAAFDVNSVATKILIGNQVRLRDGTETSSVLLGAFRLYLAHNANNELGYQLEYVGGGTANANLSVSLNMEVSWAPVDAPAASGVTFLGLTSATTPSGNAWNATTITEATLDLYDEIGITNVKTNSQLVSGEQDYTVTDAIQWVERSAIGKEPARTAGRVMQFLSRHTAADPGRRIDFVSLRVNSSGFLAINPTLAAGVRYRVYGRA